VKYASVVIMGALLGLPTVPYAIAIGIEPLAVVPLAVLGVMVGVATSAFFGDRAISALERRAEKRGRQSKVIGLLDRARPVAENSSPLWFGVFGPLMLGTFWAAMIGPAVGLSRTKTVGALFIGVLVWAVVWTVGFDLLITLFD
jgi:hypothetical protein